MKYIEENENTTREYEVKINDIELERIIGELEKRCCRAKNVSINVTASNEEEALQKLNVIKKNEVDIVKKNEVFDNKIKPAGPKSYMYECKYYYQQVPYLSHLLTVILTYYRYQPKTADITKTIDSLLEYKDSNELKPYEELMAMNGVTEELYLEYEHNKNFDFVFLNGLYEEAMKCFTLKLVSETKHYNDEESAKIYKLGRR